MEATFSELLNKKNKTYPEEMLCQAIIMFANNENKLYSQLVKRVEFIKTMKAKKSNQDAIETLTINDHENYIAARKLIGWLLDDTCPYLPGEAREVLIKVVDGSLQASLALGDLMNRFPTTFKI